MRPSGKKRKFKGEKPLFEGMKAAKLRKSKKADIQKAGRRQKLRREIREIVKLIDKSESISRNYEAKIALERDKDTLGGYLEKFNEAHAPYFDISKEHFEDVRKLVDEIKSNWNHVLADARYELIGKGMRQLPKQKKKK